MTGGGTCRCDRATLDVGVRMSVEEQFDGRVGARHAMREPHPTHGYLPRLRYHCSRTTRVGGGHAMREPDDIDGNQQRHQRPPVNPSDTAAIPSRLTIRARLSPGRTATTTCDVAEPTVTIESPFCAYNTT